MGSLLMWASRGSQAPWESGSEMEDSYTELERAVVILVENFYKYVSKHSLVKNKISKSSFRKMLQKELNHMLTVRPPRTPCVSQAPKPLCSQGGLCPFRVTHTIGPRPGPGSCPGGFVEGGAGRSQ